MQSILIVDFKMVLRITIIFAYQMWWLFFSDYLLYLRQNLIEYCIEPSVLWWHGTEPSVLWWHCTELSVLWWHCTELSVLWWHCMISHCLYHLYYCLYFHHYSYDFLCDISQSQNISPLPLKLIKVMINECILRYFFYLWICNISL